MKPALLTLIIAALLGAHTLAADPVDPETLFHQSYIQEVVEGQVAVAAMGYLKLMDDESVPAPLRAESRFRFAICCVLLGRPDEARNHLAMLLDDETAPAGVKKRAEEYRSSLEGIGAGTELSKKLEALAFELGRAPYNSSSPPTYRDFQIIGEPAVPFLKQLLGHPDDLLRWHAFRILSLMDVPGLAALWDPHRYPNQMAVDLVPYLDRSDAERERLEEIILPLDGEETQAYAVTLQVGKKWSLPLIEAVAKKDGCADLAATIGVRGPWSPGRVAMVERWLAGDDADLAWCAAVRLSNFATGAYGDQFNRPEPYLAVVRNLSTRGMKWSSVNQRRGRENHPFEDRFRSYSMAMDQEVLLTALAGLVEQGEEWAGEPEDNPLVTGMADQVAAAVTREGCTPDQLHRFRDLLIRWMEVRLDEQYTSIPPDRRESFPTRAFREQFRFLVENLPSEEAGELVASYLRRGLPGSRAALLGNVRINRPGDVAIVVAAMKEASRDEQNWLLQRMKLADLSPAAPRDEIAAKIVEAAPELAKLLDEQQLRHFFRYFPDAAARVKPEVAIEALMALGRRVAEFDDRNVDQGVYRLLGTASRQSEEEREFRRHIAVPALPQLYELWKRPVLRRSLLSAATGFLTDDQHQLPLKDALPALCAFLLEHIDEISWGFFPRLVDYREYIPLASWIPFAEPLFRRPGTGAPNIPVEDADAAAYRLVEDPKQFNAAVLGFLRTKCSPLARRSVLEQLVAATRGPDLARMVADLTLSGEPVTPVILEQKLLDLMKAEDADIGNVARLADLVARTRPSEKLFPVVLRLLESNDKLGILAGARVAKSLGRTELLDPLAAVLSSMDPEIRNAAKSAMDSIRELQKLRDEQKLREAGMLPR